MARVYGEGGSTEFNRFFKPMIRLLTVLIVITMFLGIGIGISISGNPWVGVVLFLVMLWLLWIFNWRSGNYMEALKSHQKGATGEMLVATTLEELPSDYCVFNDLFHETMNNGNFDHIVVGPTGVFVVETKNWIGTVRVNGSRTELLLNDKPCDKNFAGRTKLAAMDLKKKIEALVGDGTVPFVQAVMVFPRSYISRRAGGIPYLELKGSHELLDYLKTPRSQSRPLSNEQIKKIEKALKALVDHSKRK